VRESRSGNRLRDRRGVRRVWRRPPPSLLSGSGNVFEPFGAKRGKRGAPKRREEVFWGFFCVARSVESDSGGQKAQNRQNLRAWRGRKCWRFVCGRDRLRERRGLSRGLSSRDRAPPTILCYN